MEIKSTSELSGNERWRMIKSAGDLLERVVKNCPLVDPITFEQFVWFGREAFKFDEVRELIWPWIRWEHPDNAPFKPK